MGNGARSWTTCGKEQQPVWCAESLASDLPKTPCNRLLWVKVRGGLSGLELECLTVLTMRHGRRQGISWCFSHSDATPVCSDWSDNVWMCQLLPDYVCRLAVGETCWLQYLLLWLCQSWAWTTSCTNSRHLYTHIYRQSSSTSHSGSVLVTTATDIICLASGRLFSHSLQWCGSFHFSFSSFSAGSTSIQLRDPRPGWDVKTASRYLRLKHSL